MSTNTAAGKTIHNDKVKNLVITAFFTSEIHFLESSRSGFRLAAPVGTPFLHFGHIFVVMGLLLREEKEEPYPERWDLPSLICSMRYMQDAPKTFVETALKCLIVGVLFMMLKKKNQPGDKKKEYGAAMICAVVYGCINVIMELVLGTISMMIMGSGFAAAAVGAFTSLPATVINAVFMVIAIAVLYQPVKKIYVRMA